MTKPHVPGCCCFDCEENQMRRHEAQQVVLNQGAKPCPWGHAAAVQDVDGVANATCSAGCFGSWQLPLDDWNRRGTPSAEACMENPEVQRLVKVVGDLCGRCRTPGFEVALIEALLPFLPFLAKLDPQGNPRDT